jgi:hypothetical protein
MEKKMKSKKRNPLWYEACILLLFLTAPSAVAEERAPMELSIQPGGRWKIRTWSFIFPIIHTPQFAAWVEDEGGNYISTILVSGKIAKQNWRSAPKEGRPEALPVWTHALVRNGKTDRTEIDGVSSATPSDGVTAAYGGETLISGREYRIFFEVNHSFDYNETWPKKDAKGRRTGVNGQPSLIYYASVTAGKPEQVRLEPVGRGAPDGSHGNIISGTEGMTDALSIVDQVFIIIN